MKTYRLAAGYRPGRYGHGYMVAATGNRLPARVAEQLLASGVIEEETAGAEAAPPKKKATRKKKATAKKKATRRRSRKEN